ncbi:tRNA 2-thiouridine synthesizing protein D [Acinetobacter marinus]|uniref:tRNA 2-thiouridine synthesizing protein D n=1 Tax=Acinetobacter marinus TaxID=281375 RepID=A0A1G6INR7_9GAMM|nr:sulfurtransferase complex subunit TusD [Acinetobacter marinus]SDC08139.1 tRNA 2-thiouridine synthesizing protein D [Acinetobacter marinus]
MHTLILITAAPTTRLAYHAFQLACAMKSKQHAFEVFFYQDAVSIANAQLWHAEDELNLTQAWQSLDIPLNVCVSAALSRGVSDTENAKRHHLAHDNLAEKYCLTGLGTLAEALKNADHVLQF